tara:strand:+ start:6812 stop:7444 length:633 start_codon:yes stop_codon:yes gene_type:complete
MNTNNFFDNNLADKELLQEDGTIEQAVNVAEMHVDTKKDTFLHSGKNPDNYKNVCAKCVGNIFNEAKIPFPNTNSVVTLMDAFKGYVVELWHTDKKTKKKSIKKEVYKDADKWSPIVNPSNLKTGDVLIVKNGEGGLHATFVTKVNGNMNNQGLVESMYTGVDIIHDQGAPLFGNKRPVTRSHYEWNELSQTKGQNRSFHAAFRFVGEKK